MLAKGAIAVMAVAMLAGCVVRDRTTPDRSCDGWR